MNRRALGLPRLAILGVIGGTVLGIVGGAVAGGAALTDSTFGRQVEGGFKADPTRGGENEQFGRDPLQ